MKNKSDDKKKKPTNRIIKMTGKLKKNMEFNN